MHEHPFKKSSEVPEMLRSGAIYSITAFTRDRARLHLDDSHTAMFEVLEAIEAVYIKRGYDVVIMVET